LLHAQLFTQRQKGQLDVYGLWAVLRGQLLTDDSFVYNRALGRIKDSVRHLPEARDEDDEALLRVQVRQTCPLCLRASTTSPATQESCLRVTQALSNTS
jgi:hypothetical protein